MPISCPEDLEKLLQTAKKSRSVGKTKMNERSSRSHSVFQLTIDGENSVSGHKTRGVLNLIDLAGSERYQLTSSIKNSNSLRSNTFRLKRSEAEGDRLKETQYI